MTFMARLSKGKVGMKAPVLVIPCSTTLLTGFRELRKVVSILLTLEACIADVAVAHQLPSCSASFLHSDKGRSKEVQAMRS